MGCEFIAHKLTGVKGTEFTAKYINRFHEMEDTIQNHIPQGKELLALTVLEAQKTIEEQNAQISEMKPKADFHDAVTKSENTVSFGHFAAALNRNGLHLSRTQLFRYCRYKGYLCDAPDVHNKPTQEMINKGYMMSDKYVKYFKRKRPETSHTPKLTGKGQVWLTNRILNDYKQNPEHFMNMCNY